ncbi:hypothetical protein FQZ97_1245400 [compost metagenome]
MPCGRGFDLRLCGCIVEPRFLPCHQAGTPHICGHGGGGGKESRAEAQPWRGQEGYEDSREHHHQSGEAVPEDGVGHLPGVAPGVVPRRIDGAGHAAHHDGGTDC